ncbi:hypothetical protein ASG31_10600 [Chryseobacterium sp. Leaf404]|uniref:hypothetical protein n=1 Tax=unclassified Chryseobacterium TaxID=2593645 RepID=UPI0006F6342D|nr:MULTISPECIES: hypothetical protein [unclassified Chryseobacterium]KQT16820.1 hypothetical protein ASG31_10600 [Chryseobacterium sp. Leaf404]
MIRSLWSLFFVILSLKTFSQENSNKLGLFGVMEANVGFDVAAMIKDSQVSDEYERQNLDPGKFNYGFAAQAGYQPLDWFALATGFRYSYVDPNFHVLYWTFQPFFIVSNPKDEEFTYISANFGKQINNTASKNAVLAGFSVGFFEPITQNVGNKFQINLEVQNFDGNSTLFVGFSYGIAFFSNRKL